LRNAQEAKSKYVDIVGDEALPTPRIGGEWASQPSLRILEACPHGKRVLASHGRETEKLVNAFWGF
jgi:hypothetical protein